MDEEIKKYADSGDLNSLRYIFVDALDVDPTFADYEEDYNYCKAKGILEPHRELTPFTYDRSKWTRDYWAQLKVDLVENFSDERMDHMRQVAKVYLADKIKRLEREEQVRRLEEENKRIEAQQAAQANRVAQAKDKAQAAAQTKPQVEAQKQPPQNVASKSGGQAERDRRLEEKKKQLEEENQRIAAKQAAQAKRVAQARQAAAQAQSTQGRKTTGKEAKPPKKVIGVVAITIVVIGIVLFLILGHNPN